MTIAGEDSEYGISSLLMGIEMVCALWQQFGSFSKKLNIILAYNGAITLLGVYPIDLKMYGHTKTCEKMFMTFIYNCQKLEAIKMFFNR